MTEESQIAIASKLRELTRILNLDPSGVTREEIIDAIKNHLDREDMIKQMRAQEKGIPYQYQFGYVCWWLDKCTYLQFMDPRPEFSYLSKIENIKYPDIFAIFSCNKSSFPCFIEVKSYNKKTLKMSKTYVDGLKRHPLVREYPILMAWKYMEFWTLFDIDTFRTSAGGVHVEFLDAMKANLMSILVGDISFPGFKQEIEWHYIIEPDNINVIEDLRTGKIKKFRGTLVDVSVVDPLTDNSIEIFSSPLFYLLQDLGEWKSFTTKYTNTQIIEGDTNQFQVSLFAYQALIFGTMVYAHIKRRRTVDWRNLLRNQTFIFKFKELRTLINEGQNKEMGFEYPLRYHPSIKNPCMQEFE